MFVHDPDRYGLRGAGEISPQNDSLLHLSSAMGTPNLPSPPIDGCGCRGSWLSMFEGARLMEPWVGFVCRGRHAFSACSTRLQCETHTVSIGARRSRALSSDRVSPLSISSFGPHDERKLQDELSWLRPFFNLSSRSKEAHAQLGSPVKSITLMVGCAISVHSFFFHPSGCYHFFTSVCAWSAISITLQDTITGLLRTFNRIALSWPCHIFRSSGE